MFYYTHAACGRCAAPSAVVSRSPRNAAPAATPRRQPVPAKAKAGPARRLVRPALALVTLVLIADALVGENGWFERRREQERFQQKAAELARLHQQNAELALRARRLDAADPAVVEDLAGASGDA